MITHKKKYGIYHWDTFDNTTLLVDEADTHPAALLKVQKKYGTRIGSHGADRVEIVDKAGNIIERFQVG
jgi:hypothetical protein